jgi:hypothetical protein
METGLEKTVFWPKCCAEAMARKNGTTPSPVDTRTGHEIEIADDLKAEVFGDKYGHNERALRVSASISKPEQGVNNTNKFDGKSRITFDSNGCKILKE